jgi:hypothetical protein
MCIYSVLICEGKKPLELFWNGEEAQQMALEVDPAILRLSIKAALDGSPFAFFDVPPVIGST